MRKGVVHISQRMKAWQTLAPLQATAGKHSIAYHATERR